MPGAGTDKTRRWVEQPGPCVILVEPQLADNIGAAARAMANFGLSQLRLVAPKCGWPAERAYVMASGADRILDAAQIFDNVEAAIGDLNFVLRHDGARARPGEASGGSPAAAAEIAGGESRGGRKRRPDVRARAQRAGEPRGRARGPHHHAAGEPGLRVAQSRAGGGDRRLRVVPADDRRRAAVRYAAEIRPRAAPAAAGVLPKPRTRAGEGRVLPPARQARDDADQPAQYLLAHAADAAGHPDPAAASSWRSRKGARVRRAAACSTATRPARCARCSAEHVRGSSTRAARTDARPRAPVAAQSDRCRARAVGGHQQGPPLRRARLQAPDAGRHAHHGFRLVCAAARDRHRAGRESPGGREGARLQARLAHGARLSGAGDLREADVERRCGRRARHGGGRGRRGDMPPDGA